MGRDGTHLNALLHRQFEVIPKLRYHCQISFQTFLIQAV